MHPSLHSFRTGHKTLNKSPTRHRPVWANMWTPAPEFSFAKFVAFAFLASLPFLMIVDAANARGKPGKFDYYALALSWSPTFCASSAGRNAKQQCGRTRRFSFVVHGLWPQYHKGWPENCRRKAPYLQARFIRSLYDIMPSKRLIIHEWRKHGTCAGLSADKYFATVRELFNQIKIPARYLSPTRTILTSPQQMVTDFIKTNRNLKANMMSVQCGNSTKRARLREIRICFSRNGKLRNCGRNEARSCRARQLVLPPVR